MKCIGTVGVVLYGSATLKAAVMATISEADIVKTSTLYRVKPRKQVSGLKLNFSDNYCYRQFFMSTKLGAGYRSSEKRWRNEQVVAPTPHTLLINPPPLYPIHLSKTNILPPLTIIIYIIYNSSSPLLQILTIYKFIFIYLDNSVEI